MTRAPWLPPKTSRRNDVLASRRRVGHAGRGDHRRPQRIAGDGRLGCELRLAGQDAVGKPWRWRRRARRGNGWRGPSPHSASWMTVGTPQQPRRDQAAAASDSRRSRRPRRAAAAGAIAWPRISPAPSRLAVRASATGLRPRIVSLGTTSIIVAREQPAIAQRARIRHQPHVAAALHQRGRQRLGGKQMPAGAARRQQDQRRAAPRITRIRGRRSRSPADSRSMLGRSRVSASSMPMPKASEIMRRAAIGDERQRHALGRHQMQIDRHVDDRLHAEQDRKPRRREAREQVLGAHRVRAARA